MKNIAFIPARGGSKRLPKKNMLEINGIPMISYTIRAAKSSKLFHKIVVSSDNEEILNIAKQENVSYDKRPDELGADEIAIKDVLKEFLQRTKKKIYDNVFILSPTSPLRTELDINKAYTIYKENKKKTLISIVKYWFMPEFSLSYCNENIVKTDNPVVYLKNTRSQCYKQKYHPNGAIYIIDIEWFLKRGTYFENEMSVYEMPFERSIDIDYLHQLDLAKLFLNQNK